MRIALLLMCLFAAPLTAGSWMTNPTPRPGDWLKKHQAFLAQAQAGNIDVLFLGDSITAGWLGSGLATWRQHFAPLKAANFGIVGDGTQNVLWRITNGELDGFRAKVVVLLIGTNNIPHKFDNTTQEREATLVTEATALLIRTIQAKQPQARILLHAILPRGEWDNPGRQCIRLVNAKHDALASDTVRTLDLGHLFLDGEHISSSVMPDFLHPNGRAYSIWGPALAPAVRDLLRP